jgi:iron complex outermembrane receptor protein
VLDPTRGNAPAGAQIISPGNPNLKAERASTVTYGFVYQPHWLRGFSAALDVFSINISNAIGRLGSQTTVTQCFQGNLPLCDLITRVDGQINQITLPTLNLAQLAERGIDLETNYQMDLQDLSHLLKGSLRLRALTTYVYRNPSTTPGSATVDYASSTPTIVNLIANYNLGAFESFVQGRYIGKRKIDSTYNDSMVLDNHIKPYWYADLTLSYRPEVKWVGDVQLFGTINNVFNKQPPTGVVTNSGTGTVTDNAAYDLIGRYFTLGVRMTF